MRVLHALILIVQAIALIDAADEEPEKVKWTLHKSCYEFFGSPEQDRAVEHGVLWGVQDVKDWASKGVKKLDDSINGDDAIREAVIPLIGSEGYEDKAKDVRDKFKKYEKLEGPIGADGDGGKRYDQSEAWKALESSDKNYLNFRVVCRPQVGTIEHKDGTKHPFSFIEKIELPEDDISIQWLDDEAAGEEPPDGISAYVQTDAVIPPEGDRRHLSEAVTLNPLSIRELAENDFNLWTPDILDMVLGPNALEETKGQDAVPVDFLHSLSLAAVLFHEMFHLTTFGGLIDDPAGAYQWEDNVRLRNRENPDLLSLTAFVIEHLDSEMLSFKVSEEGDVTPV